MHIIHIYTHVYMYVYTHDTYITGPELRASGIYRPNIIYTHINTSIHVAQYKCNIHLPSYAEHTYTRVIYTYIIYHIHTLL